MWQPTNAAAPSTPFTPMPAPHYTSGRPVYAKKLLRAFADKVFDVIEAEPDRLWEVDGIGPVRAGRITAAWAEQKAVREIMVFLHSHGVGTARAVRIYKPCCGDAVQGHVQAGAASRLTGDFSRPRSGRRGFTWAYSRCGAALASWPRHSDPARLPAFLVDFGRLLRKCYSPGRVFV